MKAIRKRWVSHSSIKQISEGNLSFSYYYYKLPFLPCMLSITYTHEFAKKDSPHLCSIISIICVIIHYQNYETVMIKVCFDNEK